MEYEKLVEKFENDVKKRNRFLRLALAVDQFFNVLIWNGSQDETISSNIYRRKKKGIAYRAEKILCKFLNFIEKSHCRESKGE